MNGKRSCTLTRSMRHRDHFIAEAIGRVWSELRRQSAEPDKRTNTNRKDNS